MVCGRACWALKARGVGDGWWCVGDVVEALPGQQGGAVVEDFVAVSVDEFALVVLDAVELGGVDTGEWLVAVVVDPAVNWVVQ